MENSTSYSNLNIYAKNLGLGYLAIVFIGLLNTFLIKSGTYNVDTFLETVGRYRFAQALDLVMYCVVIWVSWSAYMVTKTVKKNLAMLALLFRFGEGAVGCVAVLISLMVAVILRDENSWAAFDAGQLKDLAVMFWDLSNFAWDVLFILMGIGATIFMWLFWVSGYIPRWLAGWGIFTYLVMCLFGFMDIIVADLPELLKLVMFPGMLFELTLGVWLLFKGLKVSTPLEQGVNPNRR